MEEKRINSVGETADTIGGEKILETPHKRRVRYKGTHPRSYKEKYKELQPEKYGDTIAKVISKGSTPAGMHISIMVKEILDFLKTFSRDRQDWMLLWDMVVIPVIC